MQLKSNKVKMYIGVLIFEIQNFVNDVKHLKRYHVFNIVTKITEIWYYSYITIY